MNTTEAHPPTIRTPPSPAAAHDRAGGAPPSACPRRRSNVRARAVEGEVVILDRQRELVHQLNQTASYIWGRCDGHHSVAAIARDLAQAFDVDLATAEHDVAHAVRQLEAAGVVETWPA